MRRLAARLTAAEAGDLANLAGSLGEMQVAACQVASTRDLDRNRAAARRLAAEHAAAGTDLVVLPEAMLCAFAGPGSSEPQPAEPLDGPFVTTLIKAVGDRPTIVVAGTFEPVAGSDRVWNTVVVVGRTGVVARYRKVHLYDALGWRESDQVQAGNPQADGVTVVEVAGRRVGVMTCYDLRFPEMGRALVDQGADVFAVPAAWVAGEGKVEQWSVQLRARAMENTVYAVGAGQPAPDYCGTTMVVDPRGGVVDALGEAGEGVVRATVSPERLRDTRRVLPLLASRRYDVHPRRRSAR